MITEEFECMECGALFLAEFIEDETEDEVKFCVSCGSKLHDELDANFYDRDEDDF